MDPVVATATIKSIELVLYAMLVVALFISGLIAEGSGEMLFTVVRGGV